MANITQIAGDTARDEFGPFYAEKIWSLIPSVYRDEDAKSRTPGALRAFVEILAEQAAVERRSVDRLWDDAHIADCDDWAIPYIADLLGTRLVSEQNVDGRRADVANTIKYRRRAGTIHLLELLADDIAGWDAVASEAFKRLHRFWHSLDCPAPIGLTTGTPQGGYARVKPFRLSDTVDTAFDDVSHFPDFRQLRGKQGRYNIPKINLHIFRQLALAVIRSTPFRFDAQHYTFDPSGRDIALFMPGRDLTEFCRSARSWEVRAPISCSLLNSGSYVPGADSATGLFGIQIQPIFGQEFKTAAALLDRAERLKGSALTLNQTIRLLDRSLRPDSAKDSLLGDTVSVALGTTSDDVLEPVDIVGGTLDAWTTLSSNVGNWIQAVIDPALGRLWLREDPGTDFLFNVLYHYGQFYPVGAGTYDRSKELIRENVTEFASVALDASLDDLNPGPVLGFTPPGTPPALPGMPGEGAYQFIDSKTYQIEPADHPNNEIIVTDDLVIQTMDDTRPYLALMPNNNADTWTFVSADNTTPNLTLDGIWLGLLPSTNTPVNDGAVAPVPTRLVIDGTFGTVTLRHMTLDPGGMRAKISPTETFVIPHVILDIQGAVNKVIIERCIMGPIHEGEDTGDRCAANEISISDSIIVSPDDTHAVLTRIAELELNRCTVFGSVHAARIFATDTIIQGLLTVDDVQGSCFRYSASTGGPSSRIPKSYRSVIFDDGLPNHIFISRRYGDAGFAQLSPKAPESIKRGAENTSEMGAFNCALDPIKRDDLIRKLSEFTAINVIPQLIMET